MMKKTLSLVLTASLILTATVAMAHPGHSSSQSALISGLLHPLMGLDHLLAMAAIGFWSVRQNDVLKQSTPIFMVSGMVLGAGIALAGVSLSGIELGIAMSVLLAGVLIATLAKLPTAIGGSLIAIFMVMHGYAHGAEMETGSSVAAYMGGFIVATLILTFAGRILGELLQKADHRIIRALGSAIAVTGGFMVAC